MSDDEQGSAAAGAVHKPSDAASGHEAMVLVRGETIRTQEPKAAPKGSPSTESPHTESASTEAPHNESSSAKSSSTESSSTESPSQESGPKDKSARKELSEAKVKAQGRLPLLDDDSDVGVQKEHIVVRDGKADLAFTGTLLASAAPASAPTGKWQEYRIFETSGGKHVFSKVSRSAFAEEEDSHEAEVFDPSPSSVPSQLLRSARDLTRSRPLTWMDAAVAFFGYDPLAKALYRKLSGQFEEHIS